MAVSAELFEAARTGDVARVEALVAAGVDLDARNAEGRTAMHDAIENGHRAVEERLLAAGAEVDVCAAAILGRLDELRAWLDRDPALANDRTTGLSPLGWAAYGNRPAAAAELIARGARLDDGELLCAASCGHVEVARVLLDHGADPSEARERDGATPLHVAATMPFTCDASAFVELLLARGADPDARLREGRTALELAERGREQEAARHPAAAPQECKRFDRVIAALRAGGAR